MSRCGRKLPPRTLTTCGTVISNSPSAPWVTPQPLAPEPPNGGTWLGYTLGTIGALLIVWLMLFGIRKRRYGPGDSSLAARYARAI